jgi:hypothetical protein
MRLAAARLRGGLSAQGTLPGRTSEPIRRLNHRIELAPETQSHAPIGNGRWGLVGTLSTGEVIFLGFIILVWVPWLCRSMWRPAVG